MRLLAPLMTIIASVTTILSVLVRTRWARTTGPQDTVPPKASPALQRAAGIWLIFVAGFTLIGFLLFVMITIINLST